MNCVVCGAEKPWWQAGNLFYCKNHKKEASAEMKRLTDRYLSRRSVKEYEFRKATEQI
jgi:hypothetical protein